MGLGSNLGDRIANLRTGATALERLLNGAEFSSLYDTTPRYLLEQPPFVNACAAGHTELSARCLLEELRRVEQRAGRRPERERYGPRTLDLDLLVYGSSVIDEPHLVIPHPRLRERGFVLLPLAELDSRMKVPASRGFPEATVGELAARVERAGVERRDVEWRGGDA